MSLHLTLSDTTREALAWEAAAHGWRLMALEGIHALRAAKLREETLQAQLSALRGELRGCVEGDRQPTDDLLL